MFSELYGNGVGEIERAALLVDAREGEQIDNLPGIYHALIVRSSGHSRFRRGERRSTDAPVQRDAPASSDGRGRFGGGRNPRGAAADGADSPARRRGDRHFEIQRARAAAVRDADRFQKAAPKPLLISVVSFGFRYGIPVGCGPRIRCALSSQSAFRAAPAPLQRQRSQSSALHSVVPANQSISSPHRKPAGLSDPALHSRRQKLFDGRVGCTGGRHRSVTLAEVIARDLKRRGYATKVVHRDLEKSGT